MGTHPIFESDFDCLTEIDELVVPLHPARREAIAGLEAGRRGGEMGRACD